MISEWGGSSGAYTCVRVAGLVMLIDDCVSVSLKFDGLVLENRL